MQNEIQQFEGFDPAPRSWDFPMCINGWVPKLSGSEFKVLWYILRHTYGWQKDSDSISYRQFRYGIKKKDGTWLDRGTGLSFTSIKKAIDGLIGMGFIEVEKTRDKKGRQSITLYRPRFKKMESGNPRFQKTESIKLNQQTGATILNNEQSLNTTNMSLGLTDWNLATEIEKLLSDQRRHIQIIGLWIKEMAWRPQNAEQLESLIKRNLKPAVLLKGYPNENIIETIKILRRTEYLKKFTLETVAKYIDEIVAQKKKGQKIARYEEIKKSDGQIVMRAIYENKS